MLITTPYLIQKSLILKSTLIAYSHRRQTTDASLASILFPEAKPVEKDETPPTPPPKPTTKQQAQAVVSSAADAAVNVLGVGLGALSAVSNRITGLTGPSKKVLNATEQLKAAAVTTPPVTLEFLQQRTISLICSVRAASSTLSQATRIEELAKYLLQHPDANYFTKKVSFHCRLSLNMQVSFVLSGTSDTLSVISTTSRTA